MNGRVFSLFFSAIRFFFEAVRHRQFALRCVASPHTAVSHNGIGNAWDQFIVTLMNDYIVR